MASTGDNAVLSAIRTLAAITVVVGHARRALFAPASELDGAGLMTNLAYLFTNLERGAVLVFFVLSGYFVGGSVIRGAREGSFDWVRYAVTRLTRLWIVLIPAILLTLVADAVGRVLSPGAAAYQESDPMVSEVVGTLFFLQLSVVGTPGTNGPLWSLAFEALYYAVFPLVVIGILGRRGGARVVSAVLLVLVLVIAFPPAWLLFPIWLMGAAVAYCEPWLRMRLSRLRPRALTGTRYLVAMVCALGWLADRGANHVWAYSADPVTYVFGALCALLLCLLLGDVHPRRKAPRAVLTGLAGYADSSYSLYAIHMPLLLLVASLMHPVQDKTELWLPSATSWIGLAAVVAGLVLGGWVFASVTERHTDRFRRAVLATTYRSRAKESSTRRKPSLS